MNPRAPFVVRSLALGLLVGLLACSSRDGSGDEPESDGPPMTATGVANLDLPQSAKLRGADVETEESGPWTIRRMARAEGDETASGRVGGKRMLRARGGGGAVRGDSSGSPPKSDAPADSFGDGGEDLDAPEAMDEVEEDPSMDAGDDAAFEGAEKSKDAAREEIGRGGAAGGRMGRRPVAKPAMEPSGDPRNAGKLRAGATDDNEDFDAFVSFLAKWSDKETIADKWDPLDVRDRRWIEVVDDNGRPVPGAEIRIVDVAKDRVLWVGGTYGDGRTPFYPSVVEKETNLFIASTEAPKLLVEARRGGVSRTARWDGKSETFRITLPVEKTILEPIALDVVFVVDTTGSMSDEIERIKGTLIRVTDRLKEIDREFDLKYGAVLYRDLGDAYVTKAHPFTGDIQAFAKALQAVKAAGGGDMPESLNQGLAEAVGRMTWRDGAAKVAFLIADAPAHMDYQGDVPYGLTLQSAVARGIRIHAVAASGLDEFGSLMFRQIAQFTRGKFIFIEYGTTAKSAEKHGVSGNVKSNNLDDILFEQVANEVATWGR